MKKWRLTSQAESSLVEIARYTLKHFGKKQAFKYRDELIACIDRIACEDIPQARSCTILVQTQYKENDLYYCRQGRHYIVFRQSASQIDVLEFFHERMDLPAHLENLLRSKE